jgi:hypothetical protein
MKTSKLILSLATFLIAGIAYGEQPGDIARGNMHFDARMADANGDGMISKDEMEKYSEDMWAQLTRNEKRTIPVADAARDFARGNLRFEAKSVDANGDGQISRDEFMKYGEAKFDKMQKDPKGISVAEASRDFGRAGMHLGQKTDETRKEDAAPK